MCTQCHKTFTVTKGTVFFRLCTSTELVVTVVTLLGHGCWLPAIVAARWRRLSAPLLCCHACYIAYRGGALGGSLGISDPREQSQRNSRVTAELFLNLAPRVMQFAVSS